MPAIDMPPQPVQAAEVRAAVPAPERALARIRALAPNTRFTAAAPSAVPGLIRLTLADGKTAYADLTGRYLILGIVFDLQSGIALDGMLEGKTASAPPAE